MTGETSRVAWGYWPVRLLPTLAGLIGVIGVAASSRLSLSLTAGALVLGAALLEARGWGHAARAHARSLSVATLAGATVCALALVAVAAAGDPDDSTLVARR